MAEKINNLKISDARIMFRNFSGRETKYNRLGNRNFHIVIDDPSMAGQLFSGGWNIKQYERDNDDVTYSLPVAVSFDNYPPAIYSVTGKTITELTEDNVHELDYADIVSIDAVIRPYRWEVNGKKGIKAYLKTLYANIEVDEFAKKYMNLDNESDAGDDDIPF